MGRLTLNVLLSFAQFEREVTGERIRDKIAASKKKGLWMGGPVPLGYIVHERKLVVDEAEAKTVRHIMQRYLELGSVRELIDKLAGEGVRTKIQVRASGPHRGSIHFARGGLFHLLKNRIYRGFIVHKGIAHPGEHPAIVPQDLWDQVQAKLADNGPRLKRIANTKHASLLVGLVYDGLGRRMSPSHACKGSKRYRYYITHGDTGIDTRNPAWRVAAHDLERIVIDRLRAFLADGNTIHTAVADVVTEAKDMEAILNAASDTALELGKSTSADRQATLASYIVRIDLKDDGVEIAVRRASLVPATLDLPVPIPADACITLTAATARVRRGHEVRLIIQAARTTTAVERDGQLAALVAEAHAARAMMLAQPERSINQIASAEGKCRAHYAQLIRLSFLAPEIVAMILEGRQPASLNRRKLMAVDLPLAWADQRVALGCA